MRREVPKGYPGARIRPVTGVHGPCTPPADTILTFPRSSWLQPIHCEDMQMTTPQAPQGDDQQKAHTPDKLRNEDARWKDKDMPEQDETAKPDDYERPPAP